MTLLGIPQERVHSYGQVISADGRVASGYTQSPISEGAGHQGFSWTATGGLDEWGSSPSVPSLTLPRANTADGAVVFGERRIENMPGRTGEAFRYSNGTYQSLGSVLGYSASGAFGASGDGSVAVGYLVSEIEDPTVAMRWTPSGGMQAVALPRANDAGGWFTGVSRDGVTAFGISTRSLLGGFDAFTWTQAGGWRQLPIPGGITVEHDAKPFGANFDGSLIVGFVEPFNNDPIKAVLWQGGLATDLGMYAPRWSMWAGSVSDDGGVIVGGGNDPVRGADHAMIWVNGGGPVKLQDYLASLGVQTPAGWQLKSCSGISSDGLTIVGTAIIGGTNQAFVATIPTSASLFPVSLCACLALRRRRRSSHGFRRSSGLVGSPLVDSSAHPLEKAPCVESIP